VKTLTVVIGILKNGDNHVLIALRPPHVSSPGIWEFPGGKVEPNETLEAALHREWREEIGIEITRIKPLLSITHETPEKRLHLHSFEIVSYLGEPRGCESQEIRWVPINKLIAYEFPAANMEIIKYLNKEV